MSTRFNFSHTPYFNLIYLYFTLNVLHLFLYWTWIHSDGAPRCPDKSDQSYCLHKVGHRMMKLELTILLILIGFSKGVHRMFRQHQPGSQDSWLRLLLLWAAEWECGARGQAGAGEGGHGQNMHGEVKATNVITPIQGHLQYQAESIGLSHQNSLSLSWLSDQREWAAQLTKLSL